MKCKCDGRWAGEHIKCEYGFTYEGKWDDKELEEHQKLEENDDNKYDFWVGFQEIKK